MSGDLAQNSIRPLVVLALGILALSGCSHREWGMAVEGSRTGHTRTFGLQPGVLGFEENFEDKADMSTRHGAFGDVDVAVEHTDWHREASMAHYRPVLRCQFVLHTQPAVWDKPLPVTDVQA